MSETAGSGSKRIAILGGTGALGTGLVRRWTQAGHAVIIGSRTLEKAEAALAELKQVMAEWGATKLDVAAMENLDAARAADIVVLTSERGTTELAFPQDLTAPVAARLRELFGLDDVR